MNANPDYGHYMFAADDMLDFYKKTDLLRGKKQVVLSYKDFLSGHVSGDFIHVCNTDVLKKYPFDENIKTYALLGNHDYRAINRHPFVRGILSSRDDINILDLFISFNPLFDSLNITILINKLINNKNEFAITSSFIFPLDK